MNKLYYGDNLTVLRGTMDDESVDLVYLDPPFNSQATYNVLFKSTAGLGTVIRADQRLSQHIRIETGYHRMINDNKLS